MFTKANLYKTHLDPTASTKSSGFFFFLFGDNKNVFWLYPKHDYIYRHDANKAVNRFERLQQRLLNTHGCALEFDPIAQVNNGLFT